MGGLIDLLIIGFVIYGILRGLSRGKGGEEVEGGSQDRSREWLEKLGLPVPPGPTDPEQHRSERTFEVEPREGASRPSRHPAATRQPEATRPAGRGKAAEAPRSIRLDPRERRARQTPDEGWVIRDIASEEEGHLTAADKGSRRSVLAEIARMAEEAARGRTGELDRVPLEVEPIGRSAESEAPTVLREEVVERTPVRSRVSRPSQPTAVAAAAEETTGEPGRIDQRTATRGGGLPELKEYSDLQRAIVYSEILGRPKGLDPEA